MMYLWIKIIHLLALISWMAGLLYLPRLFVYHCAATPGSETSETFKVMERRLLEYIINPAMIVSWVAGLWLAWVVFRFQGGWLHGKLALVIGLSAVHGMFSAAVRALDRLLVAGFYIIPFYDAGGQWVARWNHIGRPEQQPLPGFEATSLWRVP